jgi:hypothetical protein
MQSLTAAAPTIMVACIMALSTVYAAFINRGSRAVAEDLSKTKDDLARTTKERDGLQGQNDQLRADNAWLMRQVTTAQSVAQRDKG